MPASSAGQQRSASEISETPVRNFQDSNLAINRQTRMRARIGESSILVRFRVFHVHVVERQLRRILDLLHRKN
jgi:hypothetical protein